MTQKDVEIWERRYAKQPDIVARRIAGELFLVPIRGRIADMSALYSLNEVAEFLWEKLGEKSLKDLREEVLAIFEIGREEAEADILEFIDQLLKAGLIRERAGV
jgi:hypothetical protein